MKRPWTCRKPTPGLPPRRHKVEQGCTKSTTVQVVPNRLEKSALQGETEQQLRLPLSLSVPPKLFSNREFHKENKQVASTLPHSCPMQGHFGAKRLKNRSWGRNSRGQKAEILQNAPKYPIRKGGDERRALPLDALQNSWLRKSHEYSLLLVFSHQAQAKGAQEIKQRGVGGKVCAVPPQDTSQTCPACACKDAGNRL